MHELAGNDLSLQEKWLDANIIEFFNKVSFLKEFNEEKHKRENPTGKTY